MISIFLNSKLALYIVNFFQGDSGSPFVCKNEERVWTQIGIVKSSIIDETGLPCTNTLATKVDQYLKFIQYGNSQSFL